MMMRRIREEVGIDLFYPHQSRHTAAPALVGNNADPFAVHRILGHASLTTTSASSPSQPTDLREKHAAASPSDALLGEEVEAVERPRRRKLSLHDEGVSCYRRCRSGAGRGG